MRILSFILAIYFFGLSVKTCSDTADLFQDDCQTVSCDHTFIDNQHSDTHSEDSCSPLCTCQCCGGVALLLEFYTGFKSTVTPLQKPTYFEKSIKEVSFSIWQPPKLS